jgi:hypothetical protein
MKLDFLDRFSKKAQISSFTKIRPVGAELFHADRDGRKNGHDEASSHFSQFCERAWKKQLQLLTEQTSTYSLFTSINKERGQNRRIYLQLRTLHIQILENLSEHMN